MPQLEWEVEAFLSPGSPSRELVNADPYPFFDRLRAADPVHRSRKGPWLLSRYDDVLALLQSADFTRLGSRLKRLGVPTLFVLEGGYAASDLGRNAANVAEGFEQG